MLLTILLTSALTAPHGEAGQAWLERIRFFEGEGCAVEFVEERDRQVLDNGYESAIWTVQTCHGRRAYGIERFPKTLYPHAPREFLATPL